MMNICRQKTKTTDEFEISAQQHQCIKNLSAILEAAGTSLEKVVKVNVFLADMGDFAKMNEVYSTYWGDVKPCRTYVFSSFFLYSLLQSSTMSLAFDSRPSFWSCYPSMSLQGRPAIGCNIVVGVCERRGA